MINQISEEREARVYSAKVKENWKLLAIFVEDQWTDYTHLHLGVIREVLTSIHRHLCNLIYC
jgi:hypothetical protein